jgi:hypothetical protein
MNYYLILAYAILTLMGLVIFIIGMESKKAQKKA